MNDTELRWLGHSREEVIGKMKITDFLTAKSRETFQISFPLLRERGWVRDLAVEFVRRDGTIMTGLVSATAIRDAAGKFVASRAIVVDAPLVWMRSGIAMPPLSSCAF